MGRRDRNTGKIKVSLDNGGQFDARQLFDSSPAVGTSIQVNSKTKTADYRSHDQSEGLDFDLSGEENQNANRPRTDKNEEPDQENENFGNCQICGGDNVRYIECQSGFAQITFSDGSIEILATPAQIDYGVNAAYSLLDGGSGNIEQFSCATASVADDPDSEGVCLTVGTEQVCDVDPTSIEYQCLIRGYRICNAYAVSWVDKNNEPQRVSKCEAIGYRVLEKEETSYQIGNKLQGIAARLKYDSGIPRSFVVNASEGNFASGNYGYFQIYQDSFNECVYYVVGWTVDGARDDFNGAITSFGQQVVYSGGCGFQITLGAYVVDQTLQIYDSQGQIFFQTEDFLPGSVVGCEYVSGTEINTQFTGNCQGGTPEKVLAFTKTVDASTEGGLTVVDIQCL